MKAELINGPMDGMIREVDENQKVIILHQPPMSAAEFIAAQERPELMEFATMETIQHAYILQPKSITPSGYRRFIYGGVRAKR